MLNPTPEQCAVVHHDGGHALVSAVAGSGKSETLIERIAYLLENGASPSRILVLMFNKGARDDFELRLARRLPGGDAPKVFTFHSFGQRLCRDLEGQGLLPHARLLTDGVDATRFGREVLQAVNLASPSDKRADLSSDFVGEFLSCVDVLKGALYDAKPGHPAAKGVNTLFIRAFPELEAKRLEKGVRFFSDLIGDVLVAADKVGKVGTALSNRFDHIIIDEFQDINDAQMALIGVVAGDAKIMAVGDDDQTIYSWRGANPTYFTGHFERLFGNTDRYTLSRSFRYGHALSLLANFAIQQNTNRVNKICVSGGSSTTAISVRMHTHGSGPLVAAEVEAWLATGRPAASIAILVREYANAIPAEIALHRAGIPVQVVGAPSSVDRPEILAMRGYLKVASRTFSSDDPSQIINAMLTVPGLFLRRHELDAMVSTVRRPSRPAIQSLLRTLNEAAQDAPPSLKTLRLRAVATLQWVLSQHPDNPADVFLTDLVGRLDMASHFARTVSRPERAREKMNLVRQVIDLSREGGHSIGSLASFLSSLSRMAAVQGDRDAVRITSIHRAKGLEWPCVILPDLAEGVFPSADCDDVALEDERRLYYVASTRARERLVLVSPYDAELVSWARDYRSGHPNPVRMKASRFLYESNLQASLELGSELASNAFIDARRFGPAVEEMLQKYIAT